jgi:hypothetical protein
MKNPVLANLAVVNLNQTKKASMIAKTMLIRSGNFAKSATARSDPMKSWYTPKNRIRISPSEVSKAAFSVELKNLVNTRKKRPDAATKMKKRIRIWEKAISCSCWL